ncbi:DUF4347 domain-containing protein, partial [Massilia sp. NEAU-DD11]
MSSTYLDGIGDDLIISTGAAPAAPSLDAAFQDVQLARPRTEIVFIEDNVADYQSLAQQLGAGREVVILDSTGDGVHQIADALAGRTGIDALHIISHGAAGTASLGALTLDAASLGDHQADLNAIGSTMAKDGDILLYGCDTGAGSRGRALVDKLAIATGADVAASNDLTGSAARGGDWQLEVTSGKVETASVGAAGQSLSYDDVLALTQATATFDFNYGYSGSWGPQGADLYFSLTQDGAYQIHLHNDVAANLMTPDMVQYMVGSYAIAAHPAEVSFYAGKVFSVTSLDLSLDSSGANYGSGVQHADVTITGLDAHGNTVDSKTVDIAYDFNNAFSQLNTVTFSGMTEITTLKIVVDNNSSNFKFVLIDNVAVTNVHGLDTTPPTTTNASVAFSADTGASSTDLITQTAAQSISGTLGANLASDEHVEVSLDNGAHWTTASATVGTNTWSLSATLTGSNTLKVRVVDSVGNAGTADSHAYTLDTAAPAASSTPVLDAASDTGSSHSDGITAATTPTFTGTAEAGATVDLYEGSTLLGSAVATGGTWSIASSALGAGQHTVSTIVTDAAGNASGASGGLTFTVDLTAPTTTVGGIAFSADHGASNTDFITNTAAQTISGTLSAALQTGEQVEVSLDNGASWTAAQVNGTAWSLAATLAGSGTLQARVVDAVDNAGPVASQAYVLDTAAPTVTITSDVAALKAGETATVTFTFNEDPGASFTWNGTQGDVIVSGGTLSAISGSGLVRTATFTPDASTDGGTASITIGAGSYADAAGNTGGAGATPSLHFDTLAPAVPLAHLSPLSDSGAIPVDGVTTVVTPTFDGFAEAGSTITLYDTDGTTVLGSTVATNGFWSITSSTLSEGVHTITARASDAAGNASAASIGTHVTIDTTAPDAPSTPTPGATTTSDTTPTFTGTAVAGTAVDLFDTDGTTVLGSTVADGNGAWSITATTMGEGTHTVTAKATDLAGNTSAASPAQSVTIDTTAPAASSTPVLDAASDTGVSNSDGITAATTPTFTGTAEAGATVDLYEGSTLLGSAVATGGTWSIASSTLGAGQHTVSTIVTDAAGNASGASGGLMFTVDLTAPTTTVGGIAFSADHGTSGTDFITDTAAQTISGTLSAALQTGEQVEVSLDNGTSWTAAQVNGTAWSLAATLAGSGTLQARVVDAVDNAGPVASQAYVLDTAAPTVTITSDAAALKAGETATVTFTFSEDPGASFTWNGTQGDVAVSGGTLSAISGTGLVRTATFTPDANTDGGTASITIGAGSYADTAGNVGGAGTTPSLHFDTLAPVVPLAHLSPLSDSGAIPVDGVTTVVTPTFDGFAEAGSTITLYDTDGTTVLGSTVATNGFWSITSSTLSEGVHTITARAIDAAGNESAASIGTHVTIDTTAPDAPSTPTPGATTTSDTTPTFTGTAVAGTAVDLFDTDGTTVLGSTVADGNGAWSITATTLGEGTHTVTAKATDLAGNTSAASPAQSVTIDTTAPAASSTPVLDAASDTGVSNSDGITAATTPTFTGTAEAGATVDLYEGSTLLGSAVATGGIWSIASSALGAGQHTVSTIVTDAAGNASGASAGLTFTVDLTAPTTTVGGIAFSADHGASGTDFITDTAAQTISGTLNA